MSEVEEINVHPLIKHVLDVIVNKSTAKSQLWSSRTHYRYFTKFVLPKRRWLKRIYISQNYLVAVFTKGGWYSGNHIYLFGVDSSTEKLFVRKVDNLPVNSSIDIAKHVEIIDDKLFVLRENGDDIVKQYVLGYRYDLEETEEVSLYVEGGKSYRVQGEVLLNVNYAFKTEGEFREIYSQAMINNIYSEYSRIAATLTYYVLHRYLSELGITTIRNSNKLYILGGYPRTTNRDYYLLAVAKEIREALENILQIKYLSVSDGPVIEIFAKSYRYSYKRNRIASITPDCHYGQYYCDIEIQVSPDIVDEGVFKETWEHNSEKIREKIKELEAIEQVEFIGNHRIELESLPRQVTVTISMPKILTFPTQRYSITGRIEEYYVPANTRITIMQKEHGTKKIRLMNYASVTFAAEPASDDYIVNRNVLAIQELMRKHRLP